MGAGYVAPMETTRNTKFQSLALNRRGHEGDKCRIILGGGGKDCHITYWINVAQDEHGNNPSGSVKSGSFSQS
jgi:hypothetical protein